MDSQSEDKNSLKKPILWGCGSAIAIVVIIIIALFAYFSFSPESGVKMKNEIDDYIIEVINDNIILNNTETLISYYDRSMWMDASEVVILTTERVIYIKNNENSIVNINEIDDITHKNDDWGDDIILISYQDKLKFKIEISFDHNGDLFLKSLMDVWEDTKSQNP